MPLKVVRRAGKTSYYIRGTVRGTAVFESAQTTDSTQAEGYRIKRENEIWERSVHGARATVSFAEAVASYLQTHPPTFSTRRAVDRLLDHFRSFRLDAIDQAALDIAYRRLLGRDVAGATKARHVRTPLMAILEHAARRGWCARPAFERPVIAKTRMPIRLPAEVDALILHAAPHTQALFTFLAGCGPRPSEAFELQWPEVDLQGARCVVQQKQGDWRYIDLCPRVVAALAALPHRTGHVFRSRPGKQLQDGTWRLGVHYRTGETEKGVASGQVRTAFFSAAHAAGWPGHWRVWIPRGASEPTRAWVSDIPLYALRHSWASWHYCVHKDLLKLKQDGGWSEIETVAHYAKMMPDSYRAAILAWMSAGPTELLQRA